MTARTTFNAAVQAAAATEIAAVIAAQMPFQKTINQSGCAQGFW